MPRPDLQPNLGSVTGSTETYTQQGSGIIRKFNIDQIKDYLNPFFGSNLISGVVNGVDIVLTNSNGATVTITNAVPLNKEIYTGAGVPSNAIGKKDDVYLNTSNGVFYKKGTSTWSVVFDLNSYINSLSIVCENKGASDPSAIGVYHSSSGTTRFFRSIAPTPSSKIAVSTNSLGLILLDANSNNIVQDSNTNFLPEGTNNLYFTNSRVRSAITATLPVMFNSTTGIISLKISTDLGNVLTIGTDGGLKVPDSIGDKTAYIAVTTPSTEWTLVHNLGKRACIQAFTDTGDEIEGQIIYISLNSAKIVFNHPRIGLLVAN